MIEIVLCLGALTYCHVQVNMQAVVLVSVFRQASRERIMEYVEWCLPDRIPILWDRLGYTDTPAQVLHRFVVNKIKGFQAGVALRQSATHHSNRSANLTPALHSPLPGCSCASLQQYSKRFGQTLMKHLYGSEHWDGIPRCFANSVPTYGVSIRRVCVKGRGRGPLF